MTSKPKICHLIHEGTGGGGATLSLNYFHRYLADFEVVCITGKAGTLPERLRQQGLKVHALPLDAPLRCIASIPLILKVLQQERPDAITLHGQWGGTCGAIAAWLAKIPCVVYFTHMPSFYTDWDLYRCIRNHIVEKVTCSIADLVINPSEGNRYQYLIRQLSHEEKFITIPNGLNVDQIQPATNLIALRKELNLPQDRQICVSVGRLSDQKHVDWLIQAWGQAEAQIPDTDLYIIGDGELKTELEQLSQSLGLKQVRFLGNQPDGYRYFQAADFGVITTMFEAQPYSLLEAMACGCSMIGTAADGVRDTIQDTKNGLLVSVADPVALSKAIIQMATNKPARKEYSRQARADVETHYDLELISRQQIEIITQTMADSKKQANAEHHVDL